MNFYEIKMNAITIGCSPYLLNYLAGLSAAEKSDPFR